MFRKSLFFALVLSLAFAAAFADLAQAQEVTLAPQGDLNKVDPAKWTAFLPSATSGLQVKGHPHLFDRAYLFTTPEYHGDYRLSFQWRWTEDSRLNFDNSSHAAVRRPAADHLCIPLRSTMKLAEGRSWEPLDGLVARVDAGYGKVSVESRDGTNGKPIAHAFLNADDQGVNVLRDKDAGQDPAVKAGVWYDVVVTCKKGHLTFEFGGKTVVETDIKQKFKGGHVGIGNREKYANLVMHSEIQNVKLELLD